MRHNVGLHVIYSEHRTAVHAFYTCRRQAFSVLRWHESPLIGVDVTPAQLRVVCVSPTSLLFVNGNADRRRAKPVNREKPGRLYDVIVKH